MEDSGGGKFSITDDDEVEVSKHLGRRFRPINAHEEPPVIPVEDEMLMDAYNLSMRQFQSNLASGVNHLNTILEFMKSQMNMKRPDSHPLYPYIPIWEDHWRGRQGRTEESGAGEEEEDN